MGKVVNMKFLILLFLIDREDDDRTDYINTPKFRLHEHYLTTI